MSYTLFDQVADAYDTGRPTYPEEVYDALEGALGRSLQGTTVVDVGAGTGLATRGLLNRGARVIAVDRGWRMLERLRARTAGARARAVLGDGNVLPVRSGVADVVCYAQSWHWLDPRGSLVEAARALRVSGLVAAWWNAADAAAADWLAALHVRLAEVCPGYRGPALPGWSPPPVAGRMRELGYTVTEGWVPWLRRVYLEQYIQDLKSHSYVASLAPPVANALLTQERQELAKVFADGVVVEPLRVYLAFGRRP
ncbi:class I SAM-dependent methyltransferase [Rhizohabitans arisaemae]|uniref:class I SAM-dependent methyltransferase n=1 Tax=Rhizohabitans arisaemae TaxID=2720610 RepID=UPI0024B273AD|nr:class I SAM-dependent methyltransferase [Rhizohabitans arisaemae]